MIIDACANLSLEQFDSDFSYLALDENKKILFKTGTRNELINELTKCNIVSCIEMPSSFSSIHDINITESKVPNEYTIPAIGINPMWKGNGGRRIKDIPFSFIAEFNAKAIFTVLDYSKKSDFFERRYQKKLLKKCINYAKGRNFPLLITVVNNNIIAYEDLLQTLKANKYSGMKGIVYDFEGDIKIAKELANLGFCFEISLPILDEKNGKLINLVKELPLERICIGSNSPCSITYDCISTYISKETSDDDIVTLKNKGITVCASQILPLIISKIATIKGISSEKVEDIIFNNMCELLNTDYYIRSNTAQNEIRQQIIETINNIDSILNDNKVTKIIRKPDNSSEFFTTIKITSNSDYIYYYSITENHSGFYKVLKSNDKFVEITVDEITELLLIKYTIYCTNNRYTNENTFLDYFKSALH